MNKLGLLFKKKGYVIHKLSDNKCINDAQKLLINSKHGKIANENIFDKKTLDLQKQLYQNSIHLNIVKKEKNFFEKVLNVKSLNELCISSFFHLRAVRKSNKNNNFLGFHRETFYSDFDYTKHQINVSVPILNYNETNSMKVIDESHKIPDRKFKLKKISTRVSGIKKGSIKHKLGLLYNPKEIISGINLSKSKRIKCKPGRIIVFSAMLIHGGGKNFSNKPRYSIDFAFIKKKFIKNKKIKVHHVSYLKTKKYWTNIIL